MGNAAISSQQHIPGSRGLAGCNISSQGILGQAVPNANESSQILTRYDATKADFKDSSELLEQTTSEPTGNITQYFKPRILIHLCNDGHFWALWPTIFILIFKLILKILTNPPICFFIKYTV